MFFLFAFGIMQKEEKMENLVSEIGHITFCADKDTIYYANTPKDTKFLFALTEKTNDVDMFYEDCERKNKFKVVNNSFAAVFPNGNTKITFDMKKGSCISYAFTDILKQSCLSSIYVIVDKESSFKFSKNEDYSDYCLFFASPSTKYRYNITGDIKDNELSIYDEKFDSNFATNFQKTINISSSKERSNPILVRLTTGDNMKNISVSIGLHSVTESNNIAYYNGEAKRFGTSSKGVGINAELVPLIGSLPFAVFVIFLILSFVNIYRKKK